MVELTGKIMLANYLRLFRCRAFLPFLPVVVEAAVRFDAMPGTSYVVSKSGVCGPAYLQAMAAALAGIIGCPFERL